MNISLSPFAPENLVSRDGFGRREPGSAVATRVSLLILHTQAKSGILYPSCPPGLPWENSSMNSGMWVSCDLSHVSRITYSVCLPGEKRVPSVLRIRESCVLRSLENKLIN